MSSSSRLPSRECSSAGESTLLRAAASSMARGSRSSSTQIDSTIGVVVSSSSNAGIHGPRPSREQRHCVVGTERRNDDLVLTAEVQRPAAGHEDRQPRRGGEELGDESGVGRHVLEVVEHEQHVAIPNRLAQALDVVARAHVDDADRHGRRWPAPDPDRSPGPGRRTTRRRRIPFRRAAPTPPRRRAGSCRSRRDRAARPAARRGSTAGRSPGRTRWPGRGATSSAPGSRPQPLGESTQRHRLANRGSPGLDADERVLFAA